MSKLTKEVVDRIQKLRATQGLSYRQIGARLELSHDTVMKVVRGQRGVTKKSEFEAVQTEVATEGDSS